MPTIPPVAEVIAIIGLRDLNLPDGFLEIVYGNCYGPVFNFRGYQLFREAIKRT